MDVKICKNFNLCIRDFLKDILQITNITKLKNLASKINRLLTINMCSTILITKFIENIVPLNEHIKNQDSNLFRILIEKEEKGELSELMLELNKIWDTLNSNNKRKIFEYLLVLNFYAEEQFRKYLNRV
jgi:hypothetical protein